MATGALLGALTIWLSTRFIPKHELGFVGAFTNYAVIASQVLIFGLNSTLVVYVHRFKEAGGKRSLLITLCLLIPGLISVVFAVAYLLLKPWILHFFQPADIPFMDRYFSWLPIYIFLFIYMILLEQYLGSQMRVAVAAFMREVLLRVLNIVLILLFAFGYISFSVLVIGTVLIYLVPVLIYCLLAAKTEGFGISFNWRDFTAADYKELWHFSWYHSLFMISSLLLGMLDLLLIPFYDPNGFSSIAVYRVSAFLISFLLLPQKALISASFAVLTRAFTDDDMPKAKDIFSRSSLNVFLATVFIAVTISCNLPNILTIINKGYADIIPVFLILCIGNIFNVATGMNDQVLSIAKYYKFNFYLSLILMAVLFLLMRTLIPRYGIYGAAWSATAGIFAFNLVKLIFVWKKLRMQPFSTGTLLVLVAGGVAFVAGYFFPHFFDQSRHMYVRTFADVIIRSALIAVVYLVMVLWLKPSKDVEEYIGQIKKNKRLY